MKRVGIMGGTFDPIHNGHLLLAEEIFSALDLDEVMLMPTRVQPFKLEQETASPEDRLTMVNLAIENNSNFSVSTVELDNEDVSYTINSLRLLKKEIKDSELIFILGYDTFFNIEKWWKSEELLKEFSFAVGMRMGTDDKDINSFAEKLKNKYGTKIYFVKNRVFEVSSTEVKDRIKNGRSVKYLLPDAIIEYIEKNRLYL